MVLGCVLPGVGGRPRAGGREAKSSACETGAPDESGCGLTGVSPDPRSNSGRYGGVLRAPGTTGMEYRGVPPPREQLEEVQGPPLAPGATRWGYRGVS